jgi:two-component system, LytTR family, response regulator
MSRPISCILVDDDETSRFILTNLIKKNGFLNLIKSCSNALEARETIERNEIELMFLDIEMPYENGIDMLEKLVKKPNVIFITAHTKHAIKAFEFDAVDYIVKPIDLKRLNNAIEKAKRRIVGRPVSQIISD